MSSPALSSTGALDPATAYVTARAASISGNHDRAAQIYAALSARSSDQSLRNRAVAEAISAGKMDLALQLIRAGAGRPVDSRLLLVSEALRRNDHRSAVAVLTDPAASGDLSFWVPLIEAWSAADRKNPTAAFAALGRVPASGALTPFVDEQKALILLKLGRTAEAEPYAMRAVASSGRREYRLRLALAAGFAAAGDAARASAMIEGIDGDTAALQRQLRGGGLKAARIDSGAEAFSEQLIALAMEMRRSNQGGAPVNILQIAHYAAPQNSSAAVLLGNVLASVDRHDDALAVLERVPRTDPLYPDALDVQVRTLADAERFEDALAVASAAASAREVTGDDFARLGDVLSRMDRHNQAADAYQQAINRLQPPEPSRLWPLLLLQAGELEEADRWPEAKAALHRALQIAPDQPLLLNFLGYAKLERGEDLDTAEALIRKASDLDPENASITDSLGWALFKRGRVEEAIDTLEKAALGDPAQYEIHEHLGDALFTAGRRFEARFAWRAALATAEDEAEARIERKIATGLTPATAAP